MQYNKQIELNVSLLSSKCTNYYHINITHSPKLICFHNATEIT